MKKSFDGFSKGLQDGQKKNVDALNNLGKSITGVQTEADKLGKTKIEMQAELQGQSEVIAGLREMKTSGDDLNGQKVVLTADLDGNEEVVQGLENIEGIATRVDGDKVIVTAELNGGPEAVQQLEAVEFAANQLDGRHVTATIDVDGAAEAVTQTEAVSAGLDRVDGRHVEAKADVDTATASANIKSLITDLDNAGTSVGNFSRNIGLARGGVVILGAVILELASAVVPLLGGLTVLGGLVTAAAAGFGLMAGGAVKLGIGLAAVDKATQKVSDVTTKLHGAQEELNAAYASGDEDAIAAARKDVKTQTEALAQAQGDLTAVTQEQGTAVAELYQKWQEFKAALPGTFDAPAESLARLGTRLLDMATTALPSVKQAAIDTATAFEEAFGRVLDVFESDAISSALQGILDAAAPVFANLTEAAGKFGAALIQIFSVATPAAVTLAEKINSIAQAFLDWSTSAEGVNQITAAVQSAVPLFTELWEQLKNVGAALLQFSQEHGEEAVSTIKLLGEATTALITGIGDLLTAFNNLHTGLESTGASLNQISPSLTEMATGTDKTSESVGKMRTAVDNLPASLDSAAQSIRQWAADVEGYFTGVETTAGESGRGTFQAWIDGVKSGEPETKETATNLGSLLVDALNEQQAPTEEAGKQVGQHAASGFQSSEPAVEEEATNLGSLLSQKLAEDEGPTEEVATNLGSIVQDKWGGAFSVLADAVGQDLQKLWDNVKTYFTDGAVAEVTEGSATVQTETDTAWQAMAEGIGTALQTAWDYVVERFTGGAVTEVTTGDATVQTDVDTSWQAMSESIGTYLQTAWDYVVERFTGGAVTEVTTGDATVQTDVDTSWQAVADKIGEVLQTVWDYVTEKYSSGAVADMEADNAELGSDTDQQWSSIRDTITSALNAISSAVTSIMGAAAAKFRGYIADMMDAASSLLNMIGASSLGNLAGLGANAVRGQGSGMAPQGGGPGGHAKGGIDDNTEAQGPTGGVSNGDRARVVYGEQKRNVKEAYIVEDREDNVPYLEEAASWHGYSLVKMATGGTTTPTSGGTAPTTGGTGDQCFQLALIPVASPTDSALQPYADSAATQQGFMPGGVPAADWTGADHVNVPEGTISGDPFGGQGGSVPSSWPSVPLMPSGSTGTSWATTNKSGPSFLMAGGGTLPTSGGGAAPTDSAVPVSYEVVPLSTWDTFLNQQWCADPSVDWPVLYPPSEWDPSQVYSPAAMKRGGIRYFQGGGINQAQIDAGVAAGNSVLGSPYMYGEAGENGGFDCAGIWNYIEAAVVYGAPQTGKRWGTGSIPYPAGNTPGGLNFGETLTGGGGYDDTHMAGDVGGVGFESTIPNGVFNGGPATAFPDQYTAGGPTDIGGMLPSAEGVPPPSTTPAPTMDQTVADWWSTLAPPVPDPTTGATTATSQPTNQVINKKLSENTGDEQSSSGSGGTGTTPGGGTGTTPGGGTGGPTRRQRRSDKRKRRNERGKRRRTKHRQALGGIIAMAEGGTLMDGVQNWMAALPGATLPYLQNIGQQTLGSTGSVGSSPIGATLEEWIIAALEGMGMDPTPEAIATLSSLAGKESGGDPNATGAMGEYGLMQMMPDTWSAFNVGGDPYDPVANLMASINYQLNRYGSLVDFSPYKDGGMTLKPHLGLVGEGGGEAMLPLENRSVMSSLRSGLGTEGFEEAFIALSNRVDHVAERIDHQTRVLPSETGRSVKGGYDVAVTRDYATRRAFSRGRDYDARRRIFAGT